MSGAGIREVTGIVAQRQADRERWGRFKYRAPVCLPPPIAPEAPQNAEASRAPFFPAPQPEKPPQTPFPPIREAVPGKGWPKGQARVFEPNPAYSIKAILAVICEAFSVTPAEMYGQYRPQRIALPRFAFCKLLRDKRNLSFPGIARVLGRSDHTAWCHAYRRANGLLETDPQWAAAYRAAEQALGNR